MDAESTKSFYHGFILKEADLRRIVDLVEDQFRKLSNVRTTSSFRLKFKNGVIAEKNSLDEVLSQENIGSNQIIRLLYEHKTEDQVEPTFIHIEFINADLDAEPGWVSARYKVFGHTRDWVFVTSSLLEERIEKIKRFALNQLGDKGSSRFLRRLWVFLITLLFPILFFFFLSWGMNKSSSPAHRLEDEWKSGRIKDPIEAIVFLEKDREARLGSPWEIFPVRPILYCGLALIFLGAISVFFVKYYPVYNFLWGE